MLFDIVIPTLNVKEAALTVEGLQTHATYANNYIIMDNSGNPQGYIKPCNMGARAGNCEWVAFINDDITMRTYEWDEIIARATTDAVCVCPTTPNEENMVINGWFLLLKREYINTYGWAFDPQFVLYCGDVDLARRLKDDGYTPKFVEGLQVDHAYSRTTSIPSVAAWATQEMRYDIARYRNKWQSDPNYDKVRHV